MGNSDFKEKQEFVTFELIQDSLGLKDPTIFKKYLTEVFNDLANSVNNQNKKFITRMAFYDYIKLPIFIAEKVFKSFTKLSTQGLCEEEFVDNLFKLYMGSFEETISIIFNILDFDRDGIIKKEDVKIFLSYLPINDDEEEGLGVKPKDEKNKTDLVTKIFGTQMKSLEEIDDILNKAFKKYEDKMNLNQFTEIITENNSEIFLQILCFLYEQMPFSAENVEAMKIKYNQIKEEDLQTMAEDYRQRTKKSGSIRIKTPKRDTLLSPAGIFLKKFRVRKFSLNENETYFGEFRLSDKSNKKLSLDTTKASDNNGLSRKASKSISPKMQKNLILDLGNKKINNDPYNKNIDIVRLDNDNYIEKNNNQMEIEENIDIKQLVKNSRQGYTSPTKYLQDKSYINRLAVNNKNYFNIGTQLRPIKEYDDENDNKINEKMEIKVVMNNSNVTYENWVYKLTETGKMRRFYLVLVNKDIYYYKSDSKKDFVGMHNLSGCFVQECTEIKNFEGKDYYSFEIYCKNKSKLRKYFAEKESICKDFVQQIKNAIGYVKFSDLYEMKEVIGKGKFGVVNLGIHKKTGQQVAIKILNKENIKTLEDKELVQIEIGILKLCHHPNIVRLLDHLENNDYIYIVTEYIEGGTLGQYFKKKKFNFSERQATNIMSQIASGVKYLQQYGIVHRDLKPDNIMITQQNDFGVIKIMDFGLSKIISPNERMVDGYGTLSYVAPEVLLRTPYNKEVDIWSMGVILFYMLTGKLPFRGKKEQEVAEKIVYEDLEFDEDDWEIRSQSVQDLIKCCLEKNREKRITIDEFINHPWFKKNRKQKLSM
jgi:hypothetical protein